MARYLFQRLLNSILLLIGLSFLVYLLIDLAPADPAQIIAAQRVGGTPNADQIAWVRAEYGLDRPIWVQYGYWLQRAAAGDLGDSVRTGKAIAQEIGRHLRLSVALGGVTMLFVLLLALPAGVLAAHQANRGWDQLLRFNALVLVSLPDFWLGFLLILLFAVHLGWLPSFGAKSWQHFLLPVITLGLGHAARLSRLLRALLLDQVRSDYLRTARAKGMGRLALLGRHLLPNIAVPFATVAVQQLGMLISGAVIIETLFSLPGLGHYYAQAVAYRDIPVIQATVLLFAGLIVLLNLLVDLSYAVLDPRIRYQ
ncbi:MAG: ABC transporter permease [Caldilineaceae bacterium]|nr:ABC transporter permease [Caldilineaceae bacterium]